MLRDRTAERDAEEAIRESEERYRALVMTGSNMIYRMSPDWRLMYQLDGRDVLADTPEPIEDWADRYILSEDRPAVVAVIEDAIRHRSMFELEHRVRGADGGIVWVLSRAVPILGPDGEVVEWFGAGSDITERRLAEEREAFLLRLGDALRPLADPIEVIALASEALGRHLAAGRCGYGEVDATGEFFTVERDWTDGIMASFKGRHRLLDFGPEFTAAYRAGRTVLIDDAFADARAQGAEAAFEAAGGVRASLGVPLIKQGRFVAGLFVQQLPPRRWRAEEEALALEVAERTWAAVERARAEAALREATERYLGLYNAIDQGFCIIRVAFDAGDNPTDYQFVEVSPAFEAQTGIKNAAGRWMREIAPDQDQHWFDIYGHVALTNEPARFEAGSEPLGRWWSVYAYRIGDPAERTVAVLFSDITERKRTEAALSESEERFRTLAESIEDVFYMTDLERGTLDYLSPSYARVWGRPAAELMADLSRFVDTIHPEDRARFDEAKAAQGRGELVAIEYRILRPDGEERWVYDRSFPVTGSAGHRSAGTASDITERRAVEERVRQSEALFSGFAENAADVLWIANHDGTRLEYLSPSFEAMFGEARDRISADLGHFIDLVHPDDRERVSDLLPRALAGETAIVHYRVVRPCDGQVTHLRDTGFPIRDATGVVTRVAGVVQDINDIVRATAALEAEGERFRTLAEGIPQLVWRSRAGGQWTWASPQWSTFTGLSDEASRGHGWLDAVHPDDREGAKAAWDRAGEGGVFEADYRLRHVAGGGWRWFQTRGLPVRDATGDAIEWLGTSTDVDDGVRAREALTRSGEELEARVRERTAELMAAEASLRQSQKMEAIGQLTGGIAHDFNNMLQGVGGGLDMARRRLDEGRSGDTLRYMTAARDAAGRAAGLTRRLLAFARRQRLEPKPVDADALISGMADLVRRTVGPGITLDLVLHDGKWPVLCDPSELEGAVLNLCINARDAMPKGGRLTITTEEVHLSEAELRRADDPPPGDYVAIRVTDTGTGIPPEILERVLEPFFTTKPQGQGTGLGLSQVWGFARQSGGLLRIESTPGQGTAVHILLPRGQPDVERADKAAASEAADTDTVAGGTVLMVDDEAAVRGPAAERLRDLGYRVVEAADGPAALTLLDKGLRPALLVTDVGLPGGMDGRAVAEAAQRKLPVLPVLFMTGYAQVALPDNAEVITKPFDLEALAARIRAVLKG